MYKTYLWLVLITLQITLITLQWGCQLQMLPQFLPTVLQLMDINCTFNQLRMLEDDFEALAALMSSNKVLDKITKLVMSQFSLPQITEYKKNSWFLRWQFERSSENFF